MTRRALGARALASVPPLCALCAGNRRVAVISIEGIGGTVRCPHCSPTPDSPIPIWTLPMYQDQPRGETA